MADEIIEELWRIKDGIAEECGYDVKTLVAHLKTRKHEGNFEVVNLRKMKQAGRTNRKSGRTGPPLREYAH